MSSYNDKEVVAKSKGGKKVYAQKPEGEALYKLHFQGGGKLPEAWSGGYSTLKYAKLAAEAYLGQEAALQSDLDVEKGAKAAAKRPSKLKAK